VAVSFTVEIGFDSSASTRLALVSWTDVTADVRAWSVNRGRQSELSTYSAGSASVTLDNRSRTYDPSNTAGSYYGKILPRRRLRITLTAGAVSAAIFTGYVADWSMEWPEQGIDSTVTVSASDALEVLSTSVQPGSAYAAEVLTDGPTHFWPLQSDGYEDTIGSADLSQRGDGDLPSASTMSYPLGSAAAVSGGLLSATNADAALPATVEWWKTSATTAFQAVRVSLDNDNIIGMYLDDDSAQARYSNTTTNRRADASFNRDLAASSILAAASHIAITVDGTTFSVYANGFLVESFALTVGTSSTPTPIGFQPGFAMDWDASSWSHLATYSSVLTAADILRHYEAGIYAYGHPYGDQTGTRIERILTASNWPTADREITDSGATVVGQWLPAEASALAGCRECETAEQGAFFINAAGQAAFRTRNQLLTLARCITPQATFGDDAAETPVTNPLQVDGTNLDFVRNSVTVTYEGGAVTVSDETSVGDYGTLDDSVSAGLLDTASGWVARQLAAYRLRLRKTPVSRVPAVKAQLLDDLETHLAEVIPLELCDRVTVNRRPSGGTGSFSQQCHIQGIRWGWSPAQSYAWQAYLSPAVPSYSTADYLLIGDATYGKVGSTHTAVY